MASTTQQQAAQMTYDSLLESIRFYSERSDPIFLAERSTFILLAEKQIAADFKNLLQLRNVTGVFTDTSRGLLEKPARWRKTVSFSMNGIALLHRTQEYIGLINNEIAPGQPQYYTDIAYQYISVAPLPPTQLPFFLVYEEQVQPLSIENSTNLYTSEAPQLMLAQAMLQASIFLKNTNYMSMWQNQYNAAAAALRTEDAGRIVDRNTAVTSPI